MMDVIQEPAFWTVLVAAVAIALSQIPPIRELVRGADLSIVVPDQFMLWHYLGNVRANIFVDIRNKGGRIAYVNRIDCRIKDEGGATVCEIPAVTYYSRQPSSQADRPTPEYPVGLIIIKPGDHWSETVHCHKPWNDAEEERTSEIILDIRNDIETKLKVAEKVPLVEAEDELVQKAIDFFKNKFPLRRGTYHFLIAALSESGRPMCVRGFRFTLFEAHIRALRSHTEGYKYGAGIYFPIQDPFKVVSARIRPIPDQEAKSLYEGQTTPPTL